MFFQSSFYFLVLSLITENSVFSIASFPSNSLKLRFFVASLNFGNYPLLLSPENIVTQEANFNTQNIVMKLFY